MLTNQKCTKFIQKKIKYNILSKNTPETKRLRSLRVQNMYMKRKSK